MAEYYLDHGVYPAYAATPTWPNGGTPSAQDGDGAATGVASSAVASIDFTGITAAATNSLAVAGVTLTCVASGATANQFNAGSGATLATNVAAAINAAIQAATRVRDQIALAAAEQLESLPDALVFSHGKVFAADNAAKSMTFIEAVALAETKFGTLGSTGSYAPPKHPGKFKGAGVGPASGGGAPGRRRRGGEPPPTRSRPAWSKWTSTRTPAGCMYPRFGSRTTWARR